MSKLKKADHDIRVKRGLVEKEKSADLPVEPVANPDLTPVDGPDATTDPVGEVPLVGGQSVADVTGGEDDDE